ncbi:MAG TPA: phosphotransferase, partial [Gaiellaceae bacterium]
PELGVEGLLARELGLPGLRLEAIALSRVRPRSYATLFQDGRPACFVKAFRAAAPVEREHAVLEALTRAAPSSFLVPRPLAVLHWDDLSLLVLEPLAPRGLSVRGFGDDDAAVLAELPELAAALEPALGAEEGLVPRHGDFAPWNTGRVEAGYAVWDWESARLGPPLHDFFHWHVQLLALHPRSIDGLVRLATSPRGHLAALTARLGLDADAPAAALAGYLRTRVANAADPPPLRELLRSGLALLGEGEAEA